MIAFYGMGLLGSNFVRALRKRGEDVHVWNRSPERARALEEVGARAFTDAAEAVRGATRMHLSLSDDVAVDDVLEKARPGFGPGLVVVDHTTCSASGTAKRAARWAERGVAFLHAPVFMGPQNALEGTGTMLASGDKARFDAVSAELAKMTGKLVYQGPQPERAASFKLLGNLFLMFLTSGLADMFALGRALGVDPADAASLFETFNPGTTLPWRAKRMIEAPTGPASWELVMARKDARLMVEEATRAGRRLAVVPEIAREMDAWIARGHGHDDWTIVAKDAVTG